MFSPAFRDSLRSELLALAARDPRISGSAITGSAAAAAEDHLSDIDLAFGVSDASSIPAVLADFTAFLYDRHAALHHLDIHSGPWLYRVFFLPGTLQVDLAFVPASDFRPLAPTFRLISGAAQPTLPAAASSPIPLLGWAWLYALHARSSILRNKPLLAEYMLSGLRHQILSLACLRLDLPTIHGRGFDQLPASLQSELAPTLLRSLDPSELSRAFSASLQSLLREAHLSDPAFASRVASALLELSSPPAAP